MEVEARMNRQYTPVTSMMPPPPPVSRVKSFPRTKWSGLATVQETNLRGACLLVWQISKK